MEVDTAALVSYISELLEKIYYLAEASQKRCHVLSEVDNLVIKCQRTLRLCNRIKKNCEYFENDIVKETLKYGLALETQEINSSCVSDVSHDNVTTKSTVNGYVDSNQDKNLNNVLTISLKCGHTVKTKDISQVNNIEADKFWLDIINYAENILSSYQIQGKRVSSDKQTECDSQKVTDEDDQLMQQIREIFGSDSEIDKDEGTPIFTSNDTIIIKTTSSQKEENRKQGEKTNDGVKDKVVLVKDVTERTAQQRQSEKGNEALKENTDKSSGQQIEVGTKTSIGKDLNKTSQEKKDSEKEKEILDQNVINTCNKSVSEQSTNHIIESNKSVENEETTGTVDTRGNEKKDEIEGSLCVSQITESMEEDTISLLREGSDNEQSHKETSEKQIPSRKPDEILNKLEKSGSIDQRSKTGVISPIRTVELNTEDSLENIVHKDKMQLSSECPTQVSLVDKSPDTAGDSNTKNSSVIESPKASTSRNVNENNSDLEDLDFEATQIVVSRSNDEESAGSQETQICTDAREIDTDFENERNDFMAALGLSVSNVEDSLMDVIAEVPHSKVNEKVYSVADNAEKVSEFEEEERREYADEEVDDALKYIQQLDSSSESSSVLSGSLDYSQFSEDDDDSILSTSDLNLQSGTKKSKISTQSNPEQSIEEKSSSDEATSNNDNSITNFKPKDFVVKLDRVDIFNLQKKYNADAIKAWEQFLKKKYSLKECFVKLEHPRVIQMSDTDNEEMNISSSNDDDEINRLCNLSSLSRKRKIGDSPKDSKKKLKKLTRIKRRRIVDLSGSDTCDMSGFSSVSDSELNERKEKVENEEATVLDPNKLLTEIVCHTIHDSDSSSSEQENKEDEKRKKSTKKTTSDKKDEDCTRKKTWRDDPLLTGSINLPSDTKKDSSTTSKRRKFNRILSSESDSDGTTKRSIKSKKLDPTWQSDESSPTSSSGDEFEPKPYIDFLKNTKMKGLTSDDSDVEVVNDGSPSKAPVISLDSDEEREKKPGRRNILSVLLSTELTRETRKAAREEEERVLKLQQRDQMRNTQSQESTEDSLVIDTTDSYSLTVDPVLSKRLFAHQVAGVKFMWDACYLSLDSLETFEGTGCILAHNMGLGKTFQVFTLVHTLFSHSVTNTEHVLIVCPLSTVAGWSREFKSGLKLASNKTQINVISIKSSDDPDAKFACVNKWKQKGGVLIIGYEAFQKLSSSKKMSEIKGDFLRKALIDPGPDLVVCDEGHLLKNGKTLRTKALMQVRTKRRIALTGTPLQNNLTEYYFMVQFVKPNLLGTYHEFRRQFVNPIMNGQYEDSDDADITLMKKRTHVLHRLLKNTVQRYEVSELQKYLGNMKDYALFIELHPVQKELYKEYMAMAVARKNPKTTKKIKFFFTDYELARFIGSHPQLLYTMETQNAQVKKKKIKEQDIICEEPEVQEVEGIPDGWWKSKCSEEVKTNLEFGTKLQVMMGIIEEAENIGEKVLIFTSSLVELSSIEYFLKLKGTPSCPSWKPKKDYFRMDGTVPPSVRTQMCDMFNNTQNKKLRLFLMSHKVGGLGLNLVAASRVILLGANFNPSYDTQSIFRAYRFGQEKCVYIYRLISMGTMEQKIYQRCVSKLAIASRVVDKHQIARHFKNLDLDDLYQVAVDLPSERSMPSKPDDNLLSKILLKFKCIYKYHQHQKLLENRPNEDLNEEDKMKAWEEFKQISDPPPPPPPPPPVNEIGHPNSNSIFRADQVATVSNILHTRYLQLNPNAPPNQYSEPVINLPLGTPTGTQMDPLNSFNSPPGGFAHRPGVVDGNFGNLVPNPAILRVNRGTNSMNAAPTQNDKFVNVASSPMAIRKSGMLAPNPFVLGNTNNRKENVTNTKGGIMPFRKSSSDDFQKSSHLKYSRMNMPSRHLQTPGARTSTARAPDNVNMASRYSGSAMVSSRDVSQINTSITVDDDDVMVVDVPQNEESEVSLQQTIEKLNTNGLSISYGSKNVQKSVPVTIDTSIIEIL